MKWKKRILLSFVGNNDAGNLIGQKEGAIITALTNQKFDEVILLYNKSNSKAVHYDKISIYLRKKL